MVNQYVMNNMKVVKSSSMQSSQVSYDSNASQRKKMKNYTIPKISNNAISKKKKKTIKNND
jgi:hypothetical protein